MSGFPARTRPKQMQSSGRRTNSRGGLSQQKFNSNSAQHRDDNSIYNNSDLAHVFTQYFMGSPVDIVTVRDHSVSGVVKALSPMGDICIGGSSVIDNNSSSKNGVPLNEDLKKVAQSDIKYVTVRDFKNSDCVTKSELLTDDDIARKLTSTKGSIPDFIPEPFFENTDNLDEDCLTKTRIGDHWFSPQAMFDVNREKFNVPSTFDENLDSYTIKLDTSAPGFAERSARAERVARDMESSVHSRRAADMENDEGELEEDIDEEAVFSSVVRPQQQHQPIQSAVYTSSGRGFRSTGGGSSRHIAMPTSSRAEQFRAAFQDPDNRSSQSRHGRNNRDLDESRKLSNNSGVRSNTTNNTIPITDDSSVKGAQASSSPTTSIPVLKLSVKSNSIENLQNSERLDKSVSDTIDRVSLEPVILSNGTGPISDPTSSDERPVVDECKEDHNIETKKTSLNPDAPEFQPRCLPTAGSSPIVDSPVVPSIVTLPVSTMQHQNMIPSMGPSHLPPQHVYQPQSYGNLQPYPSYYLRPTPTPNNNVKPRNLVPLPQQSPNQNYIAPTLTSPHPQQQPALLQRQRSVDNTVLNNMTGMPIAYPYQQTNPYSLPGAQALPLNRSTPPQIQQHHNQTSQQQQPVPVSTPQQHYTQQQQPQQQQHVVQVGQPNSLYFSGPAFQQPQFSIPNSAAVYSQIGHTHPHVGHPQQIQIHPHHGQQQMAPASYFVQNNAPVSQQSIVVTSSAGAQQQPFSSVHNQFNNLHQQQALQQPHPGGHLNHPQNMTIQHPNQHMSTLRSVPSNHFPINHTHFSHMAAQPMYPINQISHPPQQTVSHNNTYPPRHQT